MGDWEGLGQPVTVRVSDWGGDSHGMTQRAASAHSANVCSSMQALHTYQYNQKGWNGC